MDIPGRIPAIELGHGYSRQPATRVADSIEENLCERIADQRMPTASFPARTDATPSGVSPTLSVISQVSS
ncbi:hypothetical protein MLAC_35630 [Mycobacterium lacus]|uniref:Uncharacterized protein n=1 Tax=Mycobacterium lacus TaxID=169765 RepID=A0A7I7NPP7_9MYCO|nr:hypothetical protein MLAC_35630 [Mycobacterium lacus]